MFSYRGYSREGIVYIRDGYLLLRWLHQDNQCVLIDAPITF